MVLFAEVIAFFGTASLFAWLAFIVFQDEQLVDYKPPKDNSNFLWIERTRKAREHLFTVYDFFLISFLSYVASYVGDYLVHFQKSDVIFGFSTYKVLWLYIIVGSFFLLGCLMLILPMGYIRSMSKGATTALTVNPPPLFRTILFFALGVMNVFTGLAEFTALVSAPNATLLGIWRVFWVALLIASALGFLTSLRDWNASSKVVITNFCLMMLPFFLSLAMPYLLRLCPAPCSYITAG